MATESTNSITFKETLLIEEYKRLRADRRYWDSALLRIFILLITVAFLSIGAIMQQLHLSNGQNSNNLIWKVMIIVAPYIMSIFFSVYFIIIGSIKFNCFYIKKFEEKFNDILGESIFNWELKFIEMMSRPYSIQFWGTILFAAYVLTIEVYTMYLSGVYLHDNIYKPYIVYTQWPIFGVNTILLIYHITLEKRVIKYFIRKKGL